MLCSIDSGSVFSRDARYSTDMVCLIEGSRIVIVFNRKVCW